MREHRFVVPGVPQQQGSKNPFGGDANPHLKAWRTSVAEKARELLDGDEPYRGAVFVTCDFVYPRPKSHYRTGRYANELKPDAKVWHDSKPDLDKLARAIGDALTGVLILDDAQIAGWHIRKLYGSPARAEIWVGKFS